MTLEELRRILGEEELIIEATAGQKIVLTVTVGPMNSEYSVAVDGKNLIFARVDRREDLSDLAPGLHKIGWSFAHTEKRWKHEVKLRVANKKAVVLDAGSEANKDKPFCLDNAFLLIHADADE